MSVEILPCHTDAARRILEVLPEDRREIAVSMRLAWEVAGHPAADLDRGEAALLALGLVLDDHGLGDAWRGCLAGLGLPDGVAEVYADHRHKILAIKAAGTPAALPLTLLGGLAWPGTSPRAASAHETLALVQQGRALRGRVPHAQDLVGQAIRTRLDQDRDSPIGDPT